MVLWFYVNLSDMYDSKNHVPVAREGAGAETEQDWPWLAVAKAGQWPPGHS